MKDEYETNLNAVRGDLAGVKDGYITRKQLEDKQSEMKRDINSSLSSHDDSL